MAIAPKLTAVGKSTLVGRFGTADLDVIDCGSVWTIRANTAAARRWIRENVEPPPSYLGSRYVFSGDWRPMYELAMGAKDDGLVVIKA